MKKIMIIKMSALGDVMIALPHIEAIAAQHKNDQVWVLTGPQFVDFFCNHPRLQVAVLDRRDRLFDNSTWSRILWTRKMKFDCIYDLQGNRTSRLVVRFSRSPRKVGTQPRSVYTHSPKHEYTRETRQNVFARLNETLISGGLAPASPGCSLYLAGRDREKVEQWKKKFGLQEQNYVLFHAGSSGEWLSKRWPAEYFSRLAGMFESQGASCVWVGGTDERQLNARLAEKAGVDATGLFTPLQLYYLGKSARFAVTNDSGPMHILCASGIPVYSFFGPTDWQRSHCAGQAERVLAAKVSCSPCFSGVCKSPAGHVCMKDMAPEKVFELIQREQLLNKPV